MNSEDIAAYAVIDHQVVDVDGSRMVVAMGDDLPMTGSLIRIGDLIGRVTSQIGSRRLEVYTLSGEIAPVGQAARCAGAQAYVCLPTLGTSQIEAMRFQDTGAPFVPRTPAFVELDGKREPLRTPWPLLDRCSPLVRGGLNLVIDQTDGAAFKILAEAAIQDVETVIGIKAQGTHMIAGSTDYQKLMAFRVGMAWAAYRRDAGEDVVLIAELPRQAGQPMERGVPMATLNASLGGLSSTRDSSITTILGLCLPADHPAGAIVETLPLGEFDTQIFVDADGRVDLLKSISNADLPADEVLARDRVISALGRAQAVQERAAIFGFEDLEDADQTLLHTAEQAVVQILTSAPDT